MDTLERIKAIIVDFLVPEPGEIIRTTALRADLGFDSLDDVELEIRIMDEFRIEVPTGVSDGWLTISDVEKWVEQAILDRDMNDAADAERQPNLRVV